MSTVLVDINAALITAYKAVGLGLPTAYELRDFTPQASQPWAKVTNLDAGRSPDTLGDEGQDEHRGVFQVDVYVPENDGTARILGYAESLLSYFKAGRRFTYNGQNVRVRYSSPSSIRKDDSSASYVKSVSVYWQSWSQR